MPETISFLPEILHLRIAGVKVHEFERMSLGVHGKWCKTLCFPVTPSDGIAV